MTPDKPSPENAKKAADLVTTFPLEQWVNRTQIAGMVARLLDEVAAQAERRGAVKFCRDKAAHFRGLQAGTESMMGRITPPVNSFRRTAEDFGEWADELERGATAPGGGV